MDQLFSDLFESCDQDFLAFLNRYSASRNENKVKEMIYEAHHFIQSLPDSFHWLRRKAEALNGTVETFLESAAFQEMKAEIDGNLTTALECFCKGMELLETAGITSLIPKCRLEIETVDQLIHGFRTLSFSEFAAAAQDMKFQTYTASKAEKESYSEIKDKVSFFRDKGKERMKKVRSYLSRPIEDYLEDMNATYPDAVYLCRLVESFDRIYKEKKRKEGAD